MAHSAAPHNDTAPAALINANKAIGGDHAEDAVIMHNASAFKKTRLRLTALLTTFCLEMIVAFVFDSYTDTFNKFPLLIAFQPVISAISGNVGLQCSSVNVRALAIGLADVRKPLKSVCPEVKAGLVSGTIMALIVGIVSLIWYETGTDGSTWGGSVAFAVAIAFGMFCSILSAAFTGSAAPLLFKRCGFDPSAMAGPMETAFQDIIGGTILLAVSAAILNAFGDAPADDQSCSDCVTACKIAASVLSFDPTCVQACLDNDACTGS